jgi:hypothetical protein
LIHPDYGFDAACVDLGAARLGGAAGGWSCREAVARSSTPRSTTEDTQDGRQESRVSTADRQFSLERSFEDWTALLSRALEIRGFASLTTYADGRPKASLTQLATELCGDIPSVVLEQKLITEARAAGAMERCARSLLARYLRAELPNG